MEPARQKRLRYLSRKIEGRCVRCGVPITDGDYVKCAEHRARQRQLWEDAQERKGKGKHTAAQLAWRNTVVMVESEDPKPEPVLPRRLVQYDSQEFEVAWPQAGHTFGVHGGSVLMDHDRERYQGAFRRIPPLDVE